MDPVFAAFVLVVTVVAMLVLPPFVGWILGVAP
jgi:hypothetical protein